MSISSTWRDYKHDVVGKFHGVNSAIQSMDESSLKKPETYEMFHAIHETLMRMVKSSKDLMTTHLEQEMKLVVVENVPEGAERVRINDLALYAKITGKEATFYYPQSENKGPLLFNLGKIAGALPIKNIQSDLADVQADLAKLSDF